MGEAVTFPMRSQHVQDAPDMSAVLEAFGRPS